MKKTAFTQATICLFNTWSKQKWLFWRVGFLPINQSFFNTF